MKDLNKKLLKYKEENGLTYKELGDEIGVSKNVCYDICKGRRKFLPIQVVSKMIKLLGV